MHAPDPFCFSTVTNALFQGSSLFQVHSFRSLLHLCSFLPFNLVPLTILSTDCRPAIWESPEGNERRKEGLEERVTWKHRVRRCVGRRKFAKASLTHPFIVAASSTSYGTNDRRSTSFLPFSFIAPLLPSSLELGLEESQLSDRLAPAAGCYIQPQARFRPDRVIPARRGGDWTP